MSFPVQVSAEDVKTLANQSGNTDSEVDLNDDLMIYQLVSLEKAVRDADKGFAGAVADLVNDQVKYMTAAAAMLKEDAELRRQYGYNTTGLRKVAKMIAEVNKTKEAEKRFTDLLGKEGVQKALAKAYGKA